MTRQPTRMQRIFEARDRVDLAWQHLVQMTSTDPRFDEALEAYRMAILARKQAEQGPMVRAIPNPRR